MRHAFALASALVVLSAASAARATPYVPPRLLVETPGTPAVLELWSPPGIGPSDVLARLAKIAVFERSMQYTGACDAAATCDYGGEIEVQSGPGNAIIESDNTQEAVWIWSWQKELAADGTYAPQIANAFEFLSVFPGYDKWMETGDPGPDYYSVYNCGWGVRAVVEYEAAFGDMSHHAYGDKCAQHIAANAAAVAAQTNTESGLINMATAAWAASGLWIWGEAQNDAALQATAGDIGKVAKAWIDAQPSRVSSQTWAVTGAAVYHGVLGSYMKENPGELLPWVQKIAPKLGGWIDESKPATPNDWTDWRNAHNAWNMLAQFDTGTVLGEDGTGPHNATAVSIFTKLVAQDTQGNGAIPGSQQREDAGEDESWITAYLVYFGMQPLLADMELDAGVTGGEGVETEGGVDGGAPDAAAAEAGSPKGNGCAVAPPEDGGSWPAGALGLVVALALAVTRRRGDGG